MHRSSRGGEHLLAQPLMTPRDIIREQIPQWVHPLSLWILYFPRGLRKREGTGLISGVGNNGYFCPP